MSIDLTGDVWNISCSSNQSSIIGQPTKSTSILHSEKFKGLLSLETFLFPSSSAFPNRYTEFLVFTIIAFLGIPTFLVVSLGNITLKKPYPVSQFPIK